MSQLSSSPSDPSPELTDSSSELQETSVPPSTQPSQIQENGVQNQGKKEASDVHRTPSATSNQPRSSEGDASNSTLPPQKSPPKIQRSWSLRRKVITWVLGVSFVPVLALGVTTYVSNQALQRQLTQAPFTSTDTITSTIQRQRQRLLFGTAGIAVLTGAIATLVANRTLRPVLAAITTATHLVNRLQQEEPETRAGVGGNDELSVLSTNLHFLSQHLPRLRMREEAEIEPFTILNTLAQDIRTARSQEEVLRITVTKARLLLQVDRVAVLRFHAEGESTFIEAATVPGLPQLVWSSLCDPRFQDEAITQYHLGQVEAIDDIYAAGLSDDHIGRLERFGIRADLIAPLFEGSNLFGLLIAHQCSGPRQWQQPELDLWGQIGLQVGFGLDNASLVAQAHARDEQAQMVATITQRLRTVLNTGDVLNTLVEEVRQILTADRVVVCRFDTSGHSAIAAESVLPGFTKAASTPLQDTCFRDEGFLEKYELGHIQATPDVYTAGFSSCHLKQLEYFQVRANLIAPILVQNQLFGLVIAHQCSGPRVWQPLEIDLLAQVAIQAGYTLDQAQLVDQMDAAAVQTQQLGRMIQRIQTCRDTQDILKTAVTALRQTLHADRVIVYQLDAHWNGTIVAESVLPGVPKTLWSVLPAPGLTEGLPEPSPTTPVVVIPDTDAAELSPAHQERLQHFAVEASLIAPILIQTNQLYGLLMVHQCSGPRQWQQGEIDLLTQVAPQVAFALDQVELVAQFEQNDQVNQIALQQQQQQQALLQNHIATLLQNRDTVQALSTQAFNETELVDTLYQQINSMVQTAHTILPRLKQGTLQGQVLSPILLQSQEAVDAIQTSFTASLDAVVTVIAMLQALSQPIQQLEAALTLMTDLSTQLKLQAMNATLQAGRADDTHHNFAAIGEQIHGLTRQLDTSLVSLPPVIAAIRTEAQAAITKMTWGQQQTSEGKRWGTDIQQHLQQMVAYHRQMGALVEQVAQVAAQQVTQSMATSQTIVELANLTSQISEQSAAIAKTFEQLEAADLAG